MNASKNIYYINAWGVCALLVVIGFILALLLPYIQSARGPDRATSCRNNMRNLALAIIQYEANQGRYPGYHDFVAASDGRKFSRPLMYMILPLLERTDLFEAFDAASHPEDGMPGVEFRLLWCPSVSHSETSDTSTNYVFNAGMPDSTTGATPPDWPANGVFQNRYAAAVVGYELSQNNSAYIKKHDGLESTILATERIESALWTDTDEHLVGFVWSPRFKDDPLARINSKPSGSTAGSRYALARPSSTHPGVINVAFCDGHVRRINANIDYRVYVQLMTPHGAEAAFPGLKDGKPKLIDAEFRNYELKDADLD